MAVEAALAAAVLVAFAAAARPAPGSVPAAPRAWAVAAGPYVGALLAEIAAVDPSAPSAPAVPAAPAAPAAGPEPGSGWRARLGPTTAAARRLPAPPSPAWAAEWGRALAEVSSALTTTDPGEARADITVADGDLLALSRSIAATLGP